MKQLTKLEISKRTGLSVATCNTLLLSPETALPIVVKAVASLIVAVNPSSILLAGDLLDEEKAEQVYLGCLKWIPKEYMPDFCYTDDIDLYYQEGMYQKALDQKGVL